MNHVQFQDEKESILFLRNRILHECEAMIEWAKRYDELAYLLEEKEPS